MEGVRELVGGSVLSVMWASGSGRVVHTFNSSIWEADFCELEASLVSMVSSRPTSTIQ